MYTHLGGGEMTAVYETAEVDPLLDRARAVIEKGYSAIKVVVVPLSMPLMGLPAVKHFASMIGRLRDSVGDAVDLRLISTDERRQARPSNTFEPLRNSIRSFVKNRCLPRTRPPCWKFGGAFAFPLPQGNGSPPAGNSGVCVNFRRVTSCSRI